MKWLYLHWLFLLFLMSKNAYAMERAFFKKDVPLAVVEINIEPVESSSSSSCESSSDNEDDSKQPIPQNTSEELKFFEKKEEALPPSDDAGSKQPVLSKDLQELIEMIEKKGEQRNFVMSSNKQLEQKAPSVDVAIQNVPYPEATITSENVEIREPEVFSEDAWQLLSQNNYQYRVCTIERLLSVVNEKDNATLQMLLNTMPLDDYNKMVEMLAKLQKGDKQRIEFFKKIIEFMSNEITTKNDDMQRMQEKRKAQLRRYRLIAKITGSCSAIFALWAAVTTYFAITKC